MALSPFDIIKKGAVGLVNQGKSFFNAPDNSTAGIIRNTATGIFDVPGQAFRKTASAINPIKPVTARAPFAEKESTLPYGGGLVKVGADVGSRLLEAIPLSVVTTGAEITDALRKDRKEEYSIPLINMKRLGGENPQYTTAFGETTKRIKEGEHPFVAAMGVASNKSLDVLIGAQIMAAFTRTLGKTLLKNDLTSKINSWELFGRPKTAQELNTAYRARVTQLRNALGSSPTVVETESLTALNAARSILNKQGLPTAGDIAKFRVGQASEVIGRESPTISSSLRGIDATPIRSAQTPLRGLPALPGAVEEAGQAPAFGLSVRRVKSVPNMTPAMEQRALSLELKEEALRNSPFNFKNNRLLVDKEGNVRELGNLSSRRLIEIYENQIAESGIGDPREYADGLEKYFKDKKQLEQDIIAFNKEISTTQPIVPTTTKLDTTPSVKLPPADESKAFVNPTPPPNTKQYEIKKSDIDNLKPRDISGLTGGKSFNIRDLTFSVGNQKISDVVKQGGWSLPVKVYSNFHKAEAGKTVFVNKVENDLGRVVSSLSKKERQTIADFRLGLNKKPLPPKLEKANQELTKITDKIRDDYNEWAKSVGQPTIGYQTNYLSRVSQATDDSVVTDPLRFGDYFTKERVPEGSLDVQETNLEKLLSRYISAVSNKMYMEGAYGQMSDLARLLQTKGAPKASKFVDDFIKNMRTAEEKNIVNNIARSIISARSTAALAFNPVWSLTTQPASFILTSARNTGLNIVSGSIKAFNPTKEDWEWLMSLPTYKLKTVQSLSRTGIGDIGEAGVKPKIGSKREAIDKTLGFLGDRVEEALSRNAAFIARDFGRKRGLTGDDLDIYADLQIGATQSEYTKSARPAALRNVLVRFFAPFQTYSFEAYRFGKTILGLPGGLPMNKKDRLVSLITFIAGVYSYDWLQSKITGRKISSVGSVIPIVGPVVDWSIAKVTGKEQRTGRIPVAPISEAEALINSFRYVYDDGNWEPLRKQTIKWGMGFSGLAGASQVNRLVDGMIANARGYQVTNSGNVAFKVEGFDKVIAPILGPYSTIAGREYIEGGFEPEPKTEKDLAKEVLEKIKSGEFGSEAVAEEYFKEEMKKIEKRKKADRLELPPKEYAQELLTLIESGKMTEDEAQKEFKTYENQGSDRTTEYTESRGPIGLVFDYGKAFTKDPGNAWKAMTTDEKLGVVEGNLVELTRFKGIEFNKPEGSEDYKRQAMGKLGIPWSEKGDYKLEHIVPVKAGGDTSDNNLLIVDNETHDSYTDWDFQASKAVQDKRTTRREIAKIAIQLKIDKTITVQEALDMIK